MIHSMFVSGLKQALCCSPPDTRLRIRGRFGDQIKRIGREGASDVGGKSGEVGVVFDLAMERVASCLLNFRGSTEE